MKTACIFLLVLGCTVSYSVAQERATADSATKADSLKLAFYHSQTKSNITAVILAYLIPSTGHAYAGNWGRGLLFTAGEFGCFLIVGAGLGGAVLAGEPESEALVYIGLVALTVARIWECVDASAEVDRYNEALRLRIIGVKSLTLKLLPNRSGLQLQLTYTF